MEAIYFKQATNFDKGTEETLPLHYWMTTNNVYRVGSCQLKNV